ncbi:MAG: IS21-like element helper ATPase IstB [Bdellovibrionaceae bacterium]|nr:IS21-like element helper ATPase IstB [Pseudobdellovibrionaceae bacterium]
MSLQVVKEQMRKLLLTTAASDLDEILAKQKKAVSLAWLSECLEREIDARRANSINKRIKLAKFPEIASLENFDWSFNPKIDEAAIRELATLKFVEDNEIGLFLGQPGTGKSHLGVAIGVLAAQKGYRVTWTSVKRLAKRIEIAKARNNLDVLFKQILSSKLWIMDDWGVISMNRDVSEEIFDLLDRRKHSCALLLTSNRDVDEWPRVFPDPIIANAAIDRLFERARIVVFKGESYRLKGRISCGQSDDIDMAEMAN